MATWGFHAGMESYWAEVPQGSGRCLVVGPEHLVPTITALARVIAARAGLAADDVLVALLRSGMPVPAHKPQDWYGAEQGLRLVTCS